MLLPVQTSFPCAHVNVKPIQADSTRSGNCHPEPLLQRGCVMPCSQQRQIASPSCNCQAVLQWFLTLCGKTRLPPCSPCKEGELEESRKFSPGRNHLLSLRLCGFLTWKEIIVDGSCQWSCCLIHFLCPFQKNIFRFQWFCDSPKLAPDEILESPEATNFWRFICLMQLLLIFGAYHNTHSMALCLGWPDHFSQMMYKQPVLLTVSMFSSWQFHSLPRSFPAQPLGSHRLGDMHALQLKTQIIIIRDTKHFREKENNTAKPTPAGSSCGYAIFCDFILQSYP